MFGIGNPFKTKTKVSVSTSINRAIPDNLLPNAIKTGTFKDFFQNSDQRTAAVLDEVTQSIGVKADRMCRYGQNGYLYGAPKAQILHSDAAKNLVKSRIEAIEGRTVTLDYFHYGALNTLHYGWGRLVSEYGYNQATNELTVLSLQKGKPVYLVDMQVGVTDATAQELTNGALDLWGPKPSSGPTPQRPGLSMVTATINPARENLPFILDAQAGTDYLKVTYGWETETTTVSQHVGIPVKTYHEESLTLTVVPTPDEQNLGHFQAKYWYLNGGARVYRYFTYRDGLGTYPDLDGFYETEYTEPGEFFPWAYFRYGKVDQSVDATTDAYKSTKKLLNMIGVNFKDMASAINQNPDVGQVETAMLMFAVPANTTDPTEQRYLFDFFKAIYLTTGNTGFSVSGGITPPMAMTIQDARFQTALAFTGIRHKRVAGSIGVKGSYWSGYLEETIQNEGIQRDEFGNETPTVYETKTKYHTYRKQVTDTLYDEVAVSGLTMQFNVFDGYSSLAGETQDLLVIPLDHAITQLYPPAVRETLYARAMHYVFTSVQFSKIHWYQQEWFSTVLIIAAVVYTIVTLGADGGTALTAAIAAGEYATAAWIITMAVIDIVVLRVAFKFVAKWLGPEAAAILAAVAVIYGAYDGYQAGSIAGAPWAAELLQVATGLMQGVSDNMAEALLGLKTQAEAFGLEVQEKQKLLEDSLKLLDNQHILSPMVLIDESPTDYFNRTTHSGNIGVLSIDAISNYVDIALTLPKPHQTLALDE